MVFSLERTIYYRPLGDSITLGTGAFFHRGFIHSYSNAITNVFKQPVRTELFAQRGMMSSELKQLLNDSTIQRRLAPANIITITIGSNDLLEAHDHFLNTFNPIVFERAEETFYKNLIEIIWTLHLIKYYHPSPYFIRLIGLYNPFPHLPYSAFWINRFNAILHSMESPLVRYVDVLTPISIRGRRVLSFGGVHPNRKGYQLIAKKINETGYEPLSYLQL